MRVVRYGFSPGSFSQEDRKFIARVLNDTRGWAHLGHTFLPVSGRAPRDVVVHLTPRERMAEIYPQPHLRNMSVCDTRSHPFAIHIDRTNWEHVPEEFEGDLTLYREYVVQHEFGHIIDRNHVAPGTDSSAPCPPMMQQTHGTRGRCRANPWCCA